MSGESVTVRIKVYGSKSISKLIVEPWAWEYPMAENEQLDVFFTGDPACQMAVEVVGDALILGTFDSAGADFRVERDGVKVSPGY